MKLQLVTLAIVTLAICDVSVRIVNQNTRTAVFAT
jgi:hypothetical protein